MYTRSCHQQIDTFVFPIYMLFIKFSLARSSCTVLTRSGKNRYLSLVSDLKRKAFCLSPLSMMSAVGFSQISFVRLKKFLCILSLLSVFFSEEMLTFIKCLFSFHWDDSLAFALILLVECIIGVDFQVLNWACICGINPSWSWCMIFFMSCCIWFVEDFCIKFIKATDL